MSDNVMNPAQVASEVSLREVFAAIGDNQSFRLEAGAGAGKTYSLIRALLHLISERKKEYGRTNKRIACITYTNVAKNEILTRIDNDPIVVSETIHAFSWSLLKKFSKEIKPLLSGLTDNWEKRITEFGGLSDQTVVYDLGYPGIFDTTITLHHDDVIKLMAIFLENKKFVSLLKDQFPVVLIDEYQDTNIDLAQSIVKNLIERDSGILVGFFGDHWQKIYGSRACGLIKSESGKIREIGKNANFRSVSNIVAALNRMRPELPQNPSDLASVGDIWVFHSNDWTGERQTAAHWKDDLPRGEISTFLDSVLRFLGANGYSEVHTGTKILMLTHALLADEQGYKSIPSIFDDTEDYLTPKDAYLVFLKEIVDPVCEKYLLKKYGEMFAHMGVLGNRIGTQIDKRDWIESISKLQKLRESGTVGEVLEWLKKTRKPRLSPKIEELENKVTNFATLAEEEREGFSKRYSQIEALKAVRYTEVVSLNRYIDDKTPFSTKHGVKGAEFTNVVAVFGRGWNQYNWSQMLEWSNTGVPQDKIEAYERSRNLFYVSCSRAKTRLALVFTQRLTEPALITLRKWFGTENIHPMSKLTELS